MLYFRDRDGRLQPVPGLSFERLLELIRLEQGFQPQALKPRFTLDRLAAVGQAGAQRTDLTLELDLTLHEAGWVRVPLGLQGAVLTAHDGQGDYFLQADPDRGDLVAWIHHEDAADGKVSLTLRLAVAAAADNGRSRLRVAFPRATLANLVLDVPVPSAEAQASEASAIESIEPSPAGGSRIKVAGLDERFELTWQHSAAGSPGQATPLEVSAVQVLSVDPGHLSTEATLTIRSLGGPIDRVEITLPRGARLAGSPPAGVAIEPLPRAATEPPAVLVRLSKSTAGPLELSLLVEQPAPLPGSDGRFVVEGFSVRGAVRQWGFLGVRASGDWQASWEAGQQIRQVDEAPEPLRRDDLIASFEYASLPFSLVGQLSARPTRISVSPEYVCLVGADSAQLMGRLRYVVRGARVRRLELDLAGWELEEVGPATLVSSESLPPPGAGPVSLLLQQAQVGEFELTLKARQPMAREAPELTVEFPRPVATQAAPSAIIVLPADNVILAPQKDRMQGLTPYPLQASVKLPERQQEPLLYRGEFAGAMFVAERTVHRQSLTADLATVVEVDEQQARVRQTVTYQVQFEPVDRLVLEAPAGVGLAALQVLLDGQPLPASSLRELPAARLDGPPGVRIALPATRIGRLDLQVAFAVPMDRLAPAASARLAVPLAVPLGVASVRGRAFVTARSGVAVALAKGAWTSDAKERAAGGAPPTFTASSTEPTATLPLILELAQGPTEETIVVDRCWVQSWISATGRQDRAVYRLTTSERRLRLALPAGVAPKAFEVLVDGTPQAATADRAGELAVLLPTAGGRRTHQLELRYRFASRPPRGRLDLTAPEIRAAHWIRHGYWQVVLPSDEHLLWTPQEMVSEYSWDWSGFGWHRRPALEYAQLESWSGALPGPPVPLAHNRYLFSGIGGARRLGLSTVGRAPLVFLVSLATLAAGLALVYLPWLRHGATFLVIAAAVLVFALIEPAAAVLLGQSAVVGGALVLVALGLSRRRRPPIAPPPVRGSSHGFSDRSPTEISLRPPRVGSLTSTATAPLAAQGSSRELKP